MTPIQFWNTFCKRILRVSTSSILLSRLDLHGSLHSRRARNRKLTYDNMICKINFEIGGVYHINDHRHAHRCNTEQVRVIRHVGLVDATAQMWPHEAH